MLLVVVLFVIIMIFWCIRMTSKEKEFYKLAQKTEGIVLDHTSTPKLISFTTLDGNKHQFPYYGKRPELTSSGQLLTVFYHPYNPKNFRLLSAADSIGFMQGTTLLLGIIGAVLAILSYFLYF